MKDATPLFVTYGSRLTSGVAEVFYDLVLDDPKLSPFFDGVNIDALREHMADMLCVIAGGPNIYKGRDLKLAHADYKITRDDFARVVVHLRAALVEMQIAEPDIKDVLSAVATAEDDVVTVKDGKA